MSNREFKIALINALKNRNIFTQKVSDVEIRTRCPFCGDSKSNPHTGHLYIKINPNDNYPIVYNCFKCPADGILKYSDLELLNIFGDKFKENLNQLNKTSDKIPKGGYSDIEEKYFEYKIPPIRNLKKLQYIENRLGYNFSEDEIKDIRIITSLRDFLIENKINNVMCKEYMFNLVEDHYVGFLSRNGAYILFRDITDKENIRWYKYPISSESQGQKVMYSIKSEIDILNTDDIIINLSEGVMDCLGVAYNLNNNGDRTLNIAVCGKFYNKVLDSLVACGFIGNNIKINIYADRDYTHDTSIEYYMKLFKKYKYLVGSISVHYNMLSKDCGVKKDKIKLQTHKI